MAFDTQAARFFDRENDKIVTRATIEKIYNSDLYTDEDRELCGSFEHFLEACSTDSNGIYDSIPDEMNQPVLWVEFLTGKLVTRRERNEILRDKYGITDMDEFKPESEIWDYFFYITEEDD